MENWKEPSLALKMETKKTASTAAGDPKGMPELLLIISALLPSGRRGRKRDTKLTNIPFISHQPDYHAERRDSSFS